MFVSQLISLHRMPEDFLRIAGNHGLSFLFIKRTCAVNGEYEATEKPHLLLWPG